MMQDIMADPKQSASDYQGLVSSLVGTDTEQTPTEQAPAEDKVKVEETKTEDLVEKKEEKK